jgi:hypothetical protein
VQQAEGNQRSENICNEHASPEEAQSDREFVVLVEIGQIQNTLIECELSFVSLMQGT